MADANAVYSQKIPVLTMYNKDSGHLELNNAPQTHPLIEDDRTGIDIETLKRAITDNLYYLQGKNQYLAMPHDYYMALAYTIRDRLIHRWIKTVETYFTKDIKVVCYLSVEYLMGRQLGNNLVNLGLYDVIKDAVTELSLSLDKLLAEEAEPGLGNGGLGRLAACFLDSLTTLEIPTIGYGMRYEFGIFNQVIRDGWQVERPDRWLRLGNPWEIQRPEYTVEVKLGGYTRVARDEHGYYRVHWIPERTILGTPYDTAVPGYNTNTVNTLRLWRAIASKEFNLQIFNAGDFSSAVAEKIFSENISKVLYPDDHTLQGKTLRLQQQYFFVSCTLQDIINLYLQTRKTNKNGKNHRAALFDNFHEKVAIQLNDTHPSIGIAELMRLLVDEHHVDWDKAWYITQNTFGFTNHTLLAEALECWPVSLFGSLLPRHLEIIYEINHRFLKEVRRLYPGDESRVARLSLIGETPEKHVRMAHLACVGSHAINGVAALHTELLKQNLLRDFYELYPHRFSNKTNGITPRRWLLLSNPKLAHLISEKIGDRWITDLQDLKQLEKFADDAEFRCLWRQVKQENKENLAQYIYKYNGVKVNVNSLFDIQVKRIHEYKRQLLNLLHVITLYNHIKQNPQTDILPRTFIFGGKAAPGYSMAKLIIKLINSVADVVNHDPDARSRIKVVFLANFCVTLGELIYPAADLSEQISTAGKEASGTGNMKFAINGALTIGTLDGANIEIRQSVGAENFFLFGLEVEEIASMRANNYNPYSYYNSNPQLREVINRIASGYFSPEQPDLFQPIVESLLTRDEYMVIADYQAYIDCQKWVEQVYRKPETWTQMSILNVARMGKFSSDRTIEEYCQEIWNVTPVKVEA